MANRLEENAARHWRFRELITRNNYTTVVERCVCKDDRIPEDGFRLCVTASGRAEISCSNARGERYADEALARLTGKEGTLVAEVEDHPSFALRGIIEGFYGEPYAWEKRHDVIDFLYRHRMNAYFYAPKDDAYHRDLWREPYPQAWLDQIAALVRCARDKEIGFYYCLSPGKDFRFSAEEDYDLLLKKYEQVAALGVDRFAVLFDDICAELSPQDARQFSCAAQAHCHVANILNAKLRHTGSLIFCPTDYAQNTDTPYRRAIRKYLDRDICVIWTGYNCVAEAIPERDCIAARKAFRRPLVLWDNYPVNDFQPKSRIYLDAVCNRTRTIAAYHTGCIANPSALWESSKFALSAMAEWMWNVEMYDEEGAYRRAVREHLGVAEEDYFFAGLNRSTVMRTYPSLKAAFEREDWAYLDGWYVQAERAVLRVRAHCRKELSLEWRDLFNYVLEECRLYRALRSGAEIDGILSAMCSCAYRRADQSILEYVKERTGRDITVPEREVFWDTERR